MSNSSVVEEVEYSDILPSYYVDYSMSVIVDRAVPDVRDGLKPVQRKILYAMYDMGCASNKPYKKTARVSGEVIGKYSPHGSAGVEGAIVTMAQPFKKPVPLVDGQGNFGSIEGDGAAAARYTEVRLTPFAEDCYLSNLENDTVDFHPNYDNTLEEPDVLPCLVPSVLLTGAEGIAVGMRTNIPTFNLSEVIDANIYVLTHSRVTTEKVLSILPAPDFSTGGIICNPSDMKNLYETGSGKVRIRGHVTFEPGKGKERDKLIIDEIPYTMVGNSVISFMQSVVELIESKQLSEVVDVVDQTGEYARIVLELAKGSDVEYVKNVLFCKTSLEDSMSCNFLVINNGKPETLGVVSLLRRFCEFQKSVFTRKFEHDYKKYEERRTILEAYLVCVSNIDRVVQIIRSSRSLVEARQNLYEEFHFTEEQCNSVLSIRLSKLVSMEEKDVESELSEVKKMQNRCKEVLEDDKKLTSAIVSELKKIKKKHGYDRKTKIEDIPVAVVQKREEPEREVCVVVDRFSYVHCIDSTTYARNKQAVESDFKFNILTTDKSKILFMCDNGMMYRVKVKDIPFGNLRIKGTPLDNLTSGKYSSRNNSVVSVIHESDDNVLVVTRKGKGFRLLNKDLKGTRVESCYVKLVSNDDGVVACEPVTCSNLVALTSANRGINVHVDDIPVRGRGSSGVYVIKFRSEDTFVARCFQSNDDKVCGFLYSCQCGGYGVKLTQDQVECLKTSYK